jgi:hypothetical protein
MTFSFMEVDAEVLIIQRLQYQSSPEPFPAHSGARKLAVLKSMSFLVFPVVSFPGDFPTEILDEIFVFH